MIEVSILTGRAFMRLNGTLAYLAFGRGRTIMHGWTPHTYRKPRLGLSTACHSTGIPAPHARLADWSPAPTGPCLDAGSGSASGTRRPCQVGKDRWTLLIVATTIVSLRVVVCAVHNTGGQDKAEGEGQGK